jgi:hypothetical protein
LEYGEPAGAALSQIQRLRLGGLLERNRKKVVPVQREPRLPAVDNGLELQTNHTEGSAEPRERNWSRVVSAEKGKIVKSKDDQGNEFWYVTFPGERAEEFDNQQEAELYLADMRKMDK